MSTTPDEKQPEFGPHGAILRSARPERLGEFSHFHRVMNYAASAADEPEDLLVPSFWTRCAEQLSVGDLVRAHPPDFRWWLEAVVRHIGPNGCVLQRLRGGALEGSFAPPGAMEKPPSPEGEDAPEYRFEGVNAEARWTIWLGAKILKAGFADEASARRWYGERMASIQRDQARQRRNKGAS
jgi:hypothetical protein